MKYIKKGFQEIGSLLALVMALGLPLVFLGGSMLQIINHELSLWFFGLFQDYKTVGLASFHKTKNHAEMGVVSYLK